MERIFQRILGVFFSRLISPKRFFFCDYIILSWAKLIARSYQRMKFVNLPKMIKEIQDRLFFFLRNAYSFFDVFFFIRSIFLLFKLVSEHILYVMLSSSDAYLMMIERIGL